MRNCKRACVLLIAASSFVTLPYRSDAATVFSQPAVNGASPALSDASASTTQIADNFTLSGNSAITGLHWWGIYSSVPASSDFLIRFFADSSGNPATTPFFEETLTNVVPVATALVQSGRTVQEFSATLTLPLTLSGGTPYYLSINEASAGTFWAWAGDGGGSLFLRSSDAESWNGTISSGNRAFELTGHAVPLPAAAWMGIALLSGLGAKRLRRPNTLA